jgi:hypothetical protein
MRTVRAAATGVAVAALVASIVTPSSAASGLLVPTGGYGPSPAGTTLALTRQKIISAALSEVGKVSDYGGTNGDKLGWQDLKSFFDEGSDWGPDCFKQGISVENGIKLAFRNPPGAEWCGIFGTWCFVQGGVQARWKFGVGPVPLQAHYDKTNVQPGDMGVIPTFIHHFIIIRRDGNQIWTVSGNSTNHGITLDSPRKVSDLCYYYSPCSEVWVPGTPPPAPPTPAASPSPAASHPVLQKGSTGAAVKELQQDLNAKGASLDVDGIFGPMTDRAVRSFQGSHACFVDGIVGPQTWAALEKP